MPHDPYGDDQLVELYDLDNPSGEDHAHYRALAAELDARKILDLGCGTGLLTRQLAREGRSVVGIDPSSTMLDFAARQPGAGAVTWVHGDARTIPPTADADLALCTGNAMMHIAPHDAPAVLRSLASALRAGGTLSFETRNPAARAWEQWTREATEAERDTPFGRLREWIEVTNRTGERLTFDSHNVFPDGRDRVYTSVLWFRGADDIARDLRAAGFEEIDVSGGWHGEPVTDDAPLLVVRAQRSSGLLS